MDAQTALWLLPTRMGDAWWLTCAAFALPAGIIIMLKMVINEPFNMLTVSRVVIMGSLIAFGLTPLNSGWLPWGVLMASVGGFMTTILIATGWCNRANQNETVPQAIWRWVLCKLNHKAYLFHKDAGD